MISDKRHPGTLLLQAKLFWPTEDYSLSRALSAAAYGTGLGIWL